MFIAQTLSETWFDDEAQHHRTQVRGDSRNEKTLHHRFYKNPGFYVMSPQDLTNC